MSPVREPSGSRLVSARSFEDLGPELIDVEFVVVDLETTGTNPSLDAITEIGAVRVAGGEVVEEFQTFVNPERPIPAYIARLTGINDRMVQDAPPAEAVIPTFLEFARTSALVAHNARFDIGFLRAATERYGYRWPQFDVVDTLVLARRTFGRDEVRNHKLGTLAAAVGATTVPNHRALSDARATVDVLHEAIARLGPGATHLSDLTAGRAQPSPVQMRKRHLSANIPALPGVYSFEDSEGQALYVGKSRDLRSRVRTYFGPQEKRRAVLDILPSTERISVTVCASDTEASVRELRLIKEHRPPGNRQGIRPSSGNWLRLGPGADGLRLARKVTDESAGSTFIGPLRSRHDLEPIRSLLYSTLTSQGERAFSDTHNGVELLSDSGYHERLRRILTTDPNPLLSRVAQRMRVLSDRGQFETAEALRARTELFLNAAQRAARLRSIAPLPLLVAARRESGPPIPQRGIEHAKVESPQGRSSTPAPWHWDLIAIRHGRMLSAASLPPWEDPLKEVPRLVALAASDDAQPSPLAFGHHHETELLLGWLEQPGLRLVHVHGDWNESSSGAFTLDALTAHFRKSRGADT